MPQTVPERHFYEGVWAADGPSARLRAYSCVECGHRATTWARFRAHRAGCAGTLRTGGLALPAALAAPVGERERGRGRGEAA